MIDARRQYAIIFTDGSKCPRINPFHDYRWAPVGEWTDTSSYRRMSGQHPESGGARTLWGEVPELVQIEGLIDQILGDREVESGGDHVRFWRAKRIAVGNLDVPEMPRRWKALNLSGCTDRLKLPAGGSRQNPGIMIDNLDLSNNFDLLEFPKGLIVRNWLCLAGCKQLREVPRIRIGNGFLDVTGCDQLREIPNPDCFTKIVGWDFERQRAVEVEIA